MIQKYKKKPVIIEAIQFYSNEDCLKELEQWGLKIEIEKSYRNMTVLRVPTFDGTMIATEGDYIIKNMSGYFSICSSGMFMKLYDKV